MWVKQLFAKKSLETLLAEMAGEHRLRRVLGPVTLTSLGVGAIIGAGIFVMTGRAAALDAGPAIVLSFVVAGIGCALAAFCYAEFAAMAPVAGSAYTYAYATLGELLAWIIGWDLILEYAMGCACVAASWSKYLNAFTSVIFGWQFPAEISHDPFSHDDGYLNLLAVFIMVVVTTILVVGIRESATTNAILVGVKLCVVLFVIGVGWAYVNQSNWTSRPVAYRIMPEETLISTLARREIEDKEKLKGKDANARVEEVTRQTLAMYKIERQKHIAEELVKQGKMTPQEARAAEEETANEYGPNLPKEAKDKALAETILVKVREEAPKKATEKWGILGLLGLNRWLVPIDDNTRSPFAPYGLSGIMLGAAIVFFAYIGFDSISTHSEEAIRPQRDVPLGILASLAICTVLYIGVAGVITGMVPYYLINPDAAVADAFSPNKPHPGSPDLPWAKGLIAAGALAGMTSVLLITFLSQARIFLAMARDRLLPPSIFGVVHPKFKTPHISTMLTGAVICAVAAFTPITDLEEMVNIGTLMAFVIVCASVLILRIKQPNAHRPFRCPALYVVAPLGIVVNLGITLFLPLATWLRLLLWLAVGLVIYFSYGRLHSTLGKELWAQLKYQGASPTDAPINPQKT